MEIPAKELNFDFRIRQLRALKEEKKRIWIDNEHKFSGSSSDGEITFHAHVFQFRRPFGRSAGTSSDELFGWAICWQTDAQFSILHMLWYSNKKQINEPAIKRNMLSHGHPSFLNSISNYFLTTKIIHRSTEVISSCLRMGAGMEPLDLFRCLGATSGSCFCLNHVTGRVWSMESSLRGEYSKMLP